MGDGKSPPSRTSRLTGAASPQAEENEKNCAAAAVQRHPPLQRHQATAGQEETRRPAPAARGQPPRRRCQATGGQTRGRRAAPAAQGAAAPPALLGHRRPKQRTTGCTGRTGGSFPTSTTRLHEDETDDDGQHRHRPHGGSLATSTVSHLAAKEDDDGQRRPHRGSRTSSRASPQAAKNKHDG